MTLWSGLTLGPIGAAEYLAVAAWLLTCGVCAVVTRRDRRGARAGSVLILQALGVGAMAVACIAPVASIDPRVARVIAAVVAVESALLLAGIIVAGTSEGGTDTPAGDFPAT